jgi:ATP-dependent DNA helicase DinG
VPALKSGGKVIVSTGTKTLQDQLFNKDLPMVRDALKAPVKIALLKGRANYVCPYHLQHVAGRWPLSDPRRCRRRAPHLGLCQSHAERRQGRMHRGFRKFAGLEPRHVDARKLSRPGLPDYKECFVMLARREAMAADLVVVNHHLFFADVMLRDEGMAELLPACNTVIFDEAHQLPEVATLFFGDTVSTAQVLDLARDARTEGLTNARDCLDLPTASRELEKVAKDLRLAVGIDAGRFSYGQLEEKPDFLPAAESLEAEVEAFAAILETQAERAEGLEKCWQRGGVGSAPGSVAENHRRLRALGRSFHPFAATELDAARCRRDFPETDGRPSPCLDFYLGDVGRAGQVSPLLRRAGPRRAGIGVLAQPLRLRQAGHALRAAWHAGTEFLRLYRGRR